MLLVKNGQIADDPWVAVADDEELPSAAPVIVSFARWQAERDRLIDRSAEVGVRLESDERIEDLVPDLQHLSLIALDFPIFRDGRHFSTARLLRERYAFQGELRAVGDVLRDQFLFMHRCGFDAYEVADEEQARALSTELGRFSFVYQSAATGGLPVTQLRHMHRRRKAAA